MSEIEKMYENAEIKKVRQTNIAGGDYPIAVGFEDYPQFTPEKQLSLIKWLCKNTYRNYFLIKFSFKTDLWIFECDMSDSKRHYKFSETLASMINVLWQDLTVQERTEIADILRG